MSSEQMSLLCIGVVMATAGEYVAMGIVLAGAAILAVVGAD